MRGNSLLSDLKGAYSELLAEITHVHQNVDAIHAVVTEIRTTQVQDGEYDGEVLFFV